MPRAAPGTAWRSIDARTISCRACISFISTSRCCADGLPSRRLHHRPPSGGHLGADFLLSAWLELRGEGAPEDQSYGSIHLHEPSDRTDWCVGTLEMFRRNSMVGGG